MKPSLLMPSECQVLQEKGRKGKKPWLLIIVAVFALKILCGGPGKGGNPNEEYSAGFLCAVTTQEPQIGSQEGLKSHELTPVIPLGGQMLLPGCAGNNEDQEHPERCSESFQALAAQAGVGAGPVLAQGFFLSQTYPPILQNVETHGKVEAIL